MSLSFETPRRRARATTFKSRHAKERSQQRAIPAVVVDLLLDFGQVTDAGGGCDRYNFDRRAWRAVEGYLGKTATALERYRASYLVLAPDGTVVTVGWRQ